MEFCMMVLRQVSTAWAGGALWQPMSRRAARRVEAKLRGVE